MKPRKLARIFGCPPLLWFDDVEKLHHFTGRSTDTLERWAKDGLRIHSILRGGRQHRYIITEEYLAFLDAAEQSGQVTAGQRKGGVSA